jgi:hypothetical protein
MSTDGGLASGAVDRIAVRVLLAHVWSAALRPRVETVGLADANHHLPV